MRRIHTYIIVALIISLFGGMLYGLNKLNQLDTRVTKMPVAQGLWAISQCEVQILRLLMLLAQAENGSTDHESLQSQLDVVWSRMNVIKHGDISDIARSFSGYDLFVSNLESALLVADELVDDLSAENARVISSQFAPLVVPAHEMVFSASTRISSDRANEVLTAYQIIDLAQTIGVITILIATAAFGGLFYQLVVSDREIDRRKSVEKQLRTARDEAEKANLGKSEFLAHMSHELRTPLNSILGFTQVMSEQLYGPIGDKRYLEYTRYVNQSGNFLLQIINDILDLAKVEAGEAPLNETVIVLDVIIKNSIDHVHRENAQSQAKIHAGIAANLPMVRVDKRLMTQVLVNLLSNAVKFTPPDGDIQVTATRTPGQEVIIKVTDTGCGIAPEEIESVLEPFGQARSSAQQSHGGTGLGLSLAKKFTEQHGGTLRLESVLGQGTTVTISLPPERIVT